MPGKTTRVYQQTGLVGTACLELGTSYHRQTRTEPPCPLPLCKSFTQGAAKPSPAPHVVRVRAASLDHVQIQLHADSGTAENKENKNKGQDESRGEKNACQN